jgi:hypothetical protein
MIAQWRSTGLLPVLIAGLVGLLHVGRTQAGPILLSSRAFAHEAAAFPLSGSECGPSLESNLTDRLLDNGEAGIPADTKDQGKPPGGARPMPLPAAVLSTAGSSMASEPSGTGSGAASAAFLQTIADRRQPTFAGWLTPERSVGNLTLLRFQVFRPPRAAR